MPKLKAVLFDLDDTLISWANFVDTWRAQEMRHLGYLYDYVHAQGYQLNAPLEALHEQFSRRVRVAWEKARSTLRAPHFGVIVTETLAHFGLDCSEEPLTMEACIEAYRWGPYDGVTVFPDVPDALATLRQHGVEVGIVTNAYHPAAMRDRELDQLGLLPYFPRPETRMTAADVGYLKPHPFIFRHALEVMDAAPEEAVFVGDNLSADIDGARKVGMRGVLRTVHGRTPLQRMIVPDASVDDLHQLLLVLDEWYPDWR